MARRNLSHGIVDDVLAAIGRGELTVGSRLSTFSELAERYGVGHSVVRDAMQQLAAMGLVDVRPGRGSTLIGLSSDVALGAETIAAMLSDEALDDLFALRRVIEVESATRAATSIDQDELDELGAIHRDFEEALASGSPVFQLDIDLHRSIALASNRPIFLRVLDSLSDVMASTRLEASKAAGASSMAFEQHGAVLDAIRANDPDAAGARMAEHIDTAHETLLLLRKPARAPKGIRS